MLLEISIQLEKGEKEAVFSGYGNNLWGVSVTFRVECLFGQTKIAYMKIEDDEYSNEYAWSINNYTIKSNRNINLVGKNIQDFMIAIWERVRLNSVYIGGNREPRVNQVPNEEAQLDARASNLHLVFHTLLSNDRDKFDKIESAFHSIFSDIKHIHAGLRNNVTNVEIEFEGLDKRVKLEECGTGFTHVLTMLCIVFSDQRPIVFFDEPNSYLHPSAEKSLYQLATSDLRHQFIFTSHSSLLINYPVAKTLYLVTKESNESNFTKLNSVNEALSEIGIVNSDFALSDKVLFVEGSTERDVLPVILRNFDIDTLGYNHTFVSLGGTGSEFTNPTLMSRNAKIYEELFKSISSTPVPYAILIDKDERKIQQLFDAYKDKLIILPRRELENYFLVPRALVTVLSSLGIETLLTDIEEFIQKCLDANEDRKLFPKGRVDDPLKDIVGSEVLERIFAKYHVDYSKPNHGLLIATWLLDNEVGDLHEVANLLRPFLQEG